MLWKISAIGIGPSGLGLAAAANLTENHDSDAKIEVYLCYLAVGIICGLFLLLSRVYLEVESFISLAYVPDSVFLSTNWSPYFPHIS